MHVAICSITAATCRAKQPLFASSLPIRHSHSVIMVDLETLHEADDEI